MIIRSRLLVYLFAVIIALDSTNATPTGMNEFIRYWTKPKSASSPTSRTTSADQTLYQTVSKYEQSHFSKTPKLKYEMELNAKDGSLTKREFDFQNDKRVIKKETVVQRGEKGYYDALNSFLEQRAISKGKRVNQYKPSLLNKLETYSYQALDGSVLETDFKQENALSKATSSSRVSKDNVHKKDSPEVKQLAEMASTASPIAEASHPLTESVTWTKMNMGKRNSESLSKLKIERDVMTGSLAIHEDNKKVKVVKVGDKDYGKYEDLFLHYSQVAKGNAKLASNKETVHLTEMNGDRYSAYNGESRKEPGLKESNTRASLLKQGFQFPDSEADVGLVSKEQVTHQQKGDNAKKVKPLWQQKLVDQVKGKLQKWTGRNSNTDSNEKPMGSSTHSVTVEEALDRFSQTLTQGSPEKKTRMNLFQKDSSTQKIEEDNNPLSEVLTKTSKPLLSKHDLETRMELFQKDGSLTIMKTKLGKNGERNSDDANAIITLKKGDKGYEKALKKFNDQSKIFSRNGDSIYKPSLLNQRETFTFEALDGKTSAVKFSHTNRNQIIDNDPPKLDKKSPRFRQLQRLHEERNPNQVKEQNENQQSQQNS